MFHAERPRRFLTILLCIAFASSTFITGYVLGQRDGRFQTAIPDPQRVVTNRDAEQPSSVSALDFQLFWDVWTLVQRDYLRQPVPDDRLLYGALVGLVANLGDPYSAFFDPERARLFRQDLAGELEGIGAEIGIKDKALTIIAALPGTPAERAKLAAGDTVVAIDGVSTAEMTLEEAVARIRGTEGTSVVLLIRSGASKEVREVSITRSVIQIESVRVDRRALPSGKSIPVIRLTHFNGDTVERLDGVIRALLSAQERGLILDLRNNPGGFLEAGIAVAGEWIERQVIVRERTNAGEVKDHRSHGLARLQAISTVILVNQGTASAAEIVAGALQDHHRAVVVGEATFGKGTVQHLTNLRDGSAMKLTIAEWLTPSGRSIEGNGIVPDVVVEVTSDDVRADRDPQLDRALVLLAERMIEQRSGTQ